MIGVVILLVSCCDGMNLDVGAATYLTDWKLISSSNVKVDGSVISSASFDDSKWYNVSVPCTVMACLMQNDVYTEKLFFGENLKAVDQNQFLMSWWYRTHFQLNRQMANKKINILFQGINYRASVWLNGLLVASSKDVVGAFRYFELDISAFAVFSDTQLNYIAVEVIPPVNSVFNDTTTDLAITFVDWSPPPPDSSMGIWREVKLEVTGSVKIQYPMVETKLASLQLAHLTIIAEVVNTESHSSSITVSATIDKMDPIFYHLILEPFETRPVVFSNETYPSLNVKNPTLWWPWQMGPQNLHNLSMSVYYNGTGKESNGVMGTISDFLTTEFGMREATSDLTKDGYRFYSINGAPILIRGGGWSPDLFLRASPDWLEKHFIYMRDMNLNSVRLEGKMEGDTFFQLADKYGILVMPGWCCCDSWQHWPVWKEEQFTVSYYSMLSQAKRLRIYPSVFVFVYSSDELPPPNVEFNYLRALRDSLWPNPMLSAASDRTSTLTGPTGVKMSGPYSWEPPVYWLQDTSSYGGAYGFLTEGGPGQNPLPSESFNITFPPSDYWPINADWNWHCGAQHGNFGNLGRFTEALNARHGQSSGSEQFLEKSQVMAYEAHRAMFEGYGRNKYTSTGVIQWMLNNPFPEMIWHLYDYYFNPTATYFATKVSCEPIHIQYSYDDNTIWVVNSLYVPTPALTASIQLLSFNGAVVMQQTVPVKSIGADAGRSIFTLPYVDNLTSTYFLKLSLQDASKVVSNNFYWLSTSSDVLEWSKSNWFETPCKFYADFTLLNSLPTVQLQISATQTKQQTSVTLLNPSSNIAFFIHLRIINKSTGADIWPVLWDDNYISLVGGEKRTLTAHYNSQQDVDLVVSYWNQ
uniref:Uncharacterized protein n=1 Tax=Arcella intermedia TaxID=1963864 RepID=A0A6B2KXG5_9EUKA